VISQKELIMKIKLVISGFVILILGGCLKSKVSESPFQTLVKAYFQFIYYHTLMRNEN